MDDSAFVVRPKVFNRTVGDIKNRDKRIAKYKITGIKP